MALGVALRGVATAAIDLSDGLVGDLGHILAASGVGAVIDVDAVAARVGIRTVFPEWVQPLLQWREWALSGGDDYELLFTAPPACAASVTQAAAVAQTPVFPIGRIEAEPGVRWVDSDGRAVLHHHDSYDHFA